MEPLILRNYRDADATAVSGLIRQVYGDQYAQPDVYLPHMISQHHSRQRWHSLVAEVNGQILGHATLLRENVGQGAELAVSVVHPDFRGQNIATRLGEQLRVHAQALGCRYLSIKQVTCHPYTQRMAHSLGFHNTGLLPDYVPSPLAPPTRESIVVGFQNIPGYQRPLPDLTWPMQHEAFMLHLSNELGVEEPLPHWRGAPIHVGHGASRHDLVLEKLKPGLLKQLRELPAHWLVSLRLGLSRHFALDVDRLASIGFVFTGLAPGDGHCDGWLALFHRGHSDRALQLHCPLMQRLQDRLQQKPDDV